MQFIALLSSMVRYYKWGPQFWRTMGKREFYAWVRQASREIADRTAEDPYSWQNTENDEWWEQAREKRRRYQGR